MKVFLGTKTQISSEVYSSQPKLATSLSNINQDRESFRMRNCRSATSTSFPRESPGSRLFGHDRYDSLTDAENADDWLQLQFKKLKAKRENNPEVIRRKRQEKLLLDELKHVNDEKQIARKYDECIYTVEGYGQRDYSPGEYRMQEVRLQNSQTPYHENQRYNFLCKSEISRATDVVRHKPPTPPPRARSRSPTSSPYLRQLRTRTPFQEHSTHLERNQLNRNDSSERESSDFADNRFSFKSATKVCCRPFFILLILDFYHDCLEYF
ncbi:unnamed protein product [Thelazia callipaeda]|uniref:Uncharacterized protein n=1 Tax=Thelazia callipaeda TaxID=103827 RepID=A0A0N5CX84_THECL|nr:unnamed protein product [Thelazia callipaeda]